MSKMTLRKSNTWLHVVICMAVLFMPLMFISPEESITWRNYLSRSVEPLLMLTVFYVNYLWLGKLFSIGKKRKFWIVNISLILCMAIMQHVYVCWWWQQDKPRMEHREPPHHRRPHPSSTRIMYVTVLFILRSSFSLAVCGGVGTALVLSRKWAEAKELKRKAEVAQAEAELSNLRQQINPHFLLNTLNNIYALTAFDTETAQKAIMELSKMMRHILYDNRQPDVSLKDEAEFLHNYVDLMKLRVTRNVEVSETILLPEPCLLRVTPMLFISLVENAFKHGISPLEHSFIRIYLSGDEDKIVCRIENSSFPKNDKDRSGHGIGLEQVKRRLELAYKGKYEWNQNLDKERNIYTSEIILYDTKLRNN